MVTYFQFRFLGKTYRITSLERKAFLNIKENQIFISKTRFNFYKSVLYL